MGRRGDERGNCSYFFSVAAWPGPETKGDPTSNIQIRKLPRRSVAWDGLPPFDPPSRSHSPALNLHILLFAKPHAIPAATVGRAAFKRLPAYFPRATIFDRPPSYRIVSYRIASYRIVSHRVASWSSPCSVDPFEPTVFALVLVATRLRGPYTYLLAVRGEAAALKQGVCPARSNRATGISGPFLRRLKRPSHFVRLPRPLLKLPSPPPRSFYLALKILCTLYLLYFAASFSNFSRDEKRRMENLSDFDVEDRRGEGGVAV